MSDVYTRYKALCTIKELRDVEITESEFHYAHNRRSSDVILGLKITFPVLKHWHSLVKDQDGDDLGILNFVQLLEWNIPGNSFVFVDKAEIRDEIDVHVSKLAGNVASLYRKTKGRARKDLDDRYKVIHIKKGHVKSVELWEKEKDQLEDSIKEWRKSYSNLQQSKRDLYNSLVNELAKKDKKIEELENINKELSSYILKLEGNAYKGKTFSQSKNTSRTLKSFLTRAQSALWFSKNFGIEIESLIVKETISGKQSRLQLGTGRSATDSNQNTNDTNNDNNTDTDTKGFDNLCDSDKEKVEKVLFLLDKFCVGDMFYHEFSFICDGLPKSYLIKQCRTKYNNMSHVTSLPGSYNGCQVNSFVDLLKDSVRGHLTNKKFL